MQIGDKNYHTIWLANDRRSVNIIDQRFLPFELKVVNLRTADETCVAIRDMWVRGAPLIGVAAAYGMFLALLEAGEGVTTEEVLQQADYLRATRPTAINLNFALERMLDVILREKSFPNMVDIALLEAERIKDEELEACRLIGEHGVGLIEDISRKKDGDTVNILTHCNAGWLACIDYGTATAPIYFAHNKGIKVHVWVDETRPRNQGARLTAFELEQHGIPCTLIADNTGGHLMQHGMVDLVITGTDRTTRRGDVANKIGTYLKALAANDNAIPFYVAAPSSSIDWTIMDGISDIPIEERDGNEVKFMEGIVNGKVETVLITSETVRAVNFGFDVTPARLVTGLITERGICRANEEDITGLFPDKKR